MTYMIITVITKLLNKYVKLSRYDTEDVGAKKYVVRRYLNCKMMDERFVENEQLQIALIIDTHPPGWKDFKNLLRHKTKEFTIESLITRLRIKEETRRQV